MLKLKQMQQPTMMMIIVDLAADSDCFGYYFVDAAPKFSPWKSRSYQLPFASAY